MRIGEYDVLWRDFGFTWAVPVIRRRVRTLGFLWWRWKAVDYEGHAKPRSYVARMHPTEMRLWFAEAARSFEAYERAWADETPPTSQGKK